MGEIVTDKDGYFEFNNVEPGKYKIFAIAENGEKHVLREVEIKESVELSVKLLYDIDTYAENNEKQDGVNILLIVFLGIAGVLIVGGTAMLIIFRKKFLNKSNLLWKEEITIMEYYFSSHTCDSF